MAISDPTPGDGPLPGASPDAIAAIGVDRAAIAPPPVSATEPDWSREAVRPFEWAPSRKLLKTIRDYQRFAGKRAIHARLFRKWAVLRYRFWSVVTGADIPLNTRIGGGLLMPHPNGIIIHPDVEIGPNCLLMQQVTLGFRATGVPRLGGHVDIGAGAKVLGHITLGDHATVGACALVLDAVAPNATVFGIPARPLGGDARRDRTGNADRQDQP